MTLLSLEQQHLAALRGHPRLRFHASATGGGAVIYNLVSEPSAFLFRNRLVRAGAAAPAMLIIQLVRNAHVDQKKRAPCVRNLTVTRARIEQAQGSHKHRTEKNIE